MIDGLFNFFEGMVDGLLLPLEKKYD